MQSIGARILKHKNPESDASNSKENNKILWDQAPGVKIHSTHLTLELPNRITSSFKSFLMYSGTVLKTRGQMIQNDSMPASWKGKQSNQMSVQPLTSVFRVLITCLQKACKYRIFACWFSKSCSQFCCPIRIPMDVSCCTSSQQCHHNSSINSSSQRNTHVLENLLVPPFFDHPHIENVTYKAT